MVAMIVAAVAGVLLDRVTKVAAPGDVGRLTVGRLDETASLVAGGAGARGAVAGGAGAGDAGARGGRRGARSESTGLLELLRSRRTPGGGAALVDGRIRRGRGYGRWARWDAIYADEALRIVQQVPHQRVVAQLQLDLMRGAILIIRVHLQIKDKDQDED